MKNKYGTMRVLSRWLDLLPQILDLWRLFIAYAAFQTILSIICNRWSYGCDGRNPGYWCYLYNNHLTLVLSAGIVWCIMAFILYCLFAKDFYDSILGRHVFQPKEILKLSKKRLKSVGVMFGFLLSIIIPCGILTYIINPMQIPSWHTANPNWRIELIYFTVAFICMAIPLIIMRCAGGVAYFFNEERIPFLKIYNLTFGRAYVGIFSFLLLMLLCSNLQLSFVRYFNKAAESYNFLSAAILIEFCNNLMILCYFSLFLLLFQAEYLLLKENDAENQGDSAQGDSVVNMSEIENTSAEEPVVKGKTKKAAKKKKSQRKAKQNKKG